MVIGFTIIGATGTDIQDASDRIDGESQCGGFWNETGDTCYTDSNENVSLAFTRLPLGGLFDDTGVLLLVLMAGLVIFFVGKNLKGK